MDQPAVSIAAPDLADLESRNDNEAVVSGRGFARGDEIVPLAFTMIARASRC